MVKKICGVIAFLILSMTLVSCKKSKYEVVFRDYTGAILKTETVVDGTAATAPADPVREGYNFTGWDVSFDNVTGNIDVKAEYAIKKYEVKFFVNGEQYGTTQQVEHGKNATLPDAPVKTGYTFTGWVGDYTHVTKAASVNAVFNKNVYKVTFKDYNGYVIKETHVEHGEDAVPPANPVREGYNFMGWSETLTDVVYDFVVTANYEVKKYTVSFFVDGNLVEGSTQEVEHGKNAVLPNAPVKEGYTFTGWAGNYTNVVEAANINAVFNKNVYKVTFKDHNGYTIKEEHVEHGNNATAPAAPDNKVGYHFKQWLGSFTNITKNTEIVASYEVNKYTVKFFVDGNLVAESTQEVEHGKDAVLPANPAKVGFTFTGWAGNYTNVVEAANINAVFNKNVYKVIFKDYNGYIIKEEYVEHGKDATAPSPSREGYTFKEWTAAYTNVTADVVTEAQYTIKKYTISFFVDGNLVVGSTQEVEHGKNAVLPVDPIKEGHTFTGWDGDYTNVVKPDDIDATFEINVYKVTFKDYNGYIVKEEYVEHGQSATAPTPNREGYDFDGWTNPYVNVKANVVTEAQYTRKHYTVRFLLDGVPIPNTTKEVFHGEDAELPANPVKEGYTFNGWLGDHTRVVNHIDIIAKMDINVYRVVFMDWNNYIIKEQQVTHGSAATAPTPNPTREGYTFKEWLGAFNNITAYTEVKASYDINNYQITYDVNGGTPINGEMMDHGETFTLPLPVKEGYTFVHWKVGENYYEAGTIYTTVEAITFVAQWAIEQDYTLSFESNGGNAIASQIVRKFNYVDTLPTPVRTNWTFVGWSMDGEMIEAPFRYTYNNNIQLLAIWTRTNEGIKYIDEAIVNGITVSKYTGTAADVTISLMFDGEVITRIADDAFNGNNSVKTVWVNSGVEKVGNRAFANMSQLKSIEFKNTTQMFGASVFEGSNALEKMTLSSKIANPLRYYFGNLDSKIPDSLATIAYADGDLGVIDKTLTQNALKNAQLNLAQDTTEIVAEQFKFSKLTKILIPKNVTVVNSQAFMSSYFLTDVIFENGSLLQNLGANSFNSCVKLVNMTLADTAQLSTLSVGVFFNCTSLKTMTIHNNVTYIGNAVFGSCKSLESLTIPYVGRQRADTGDYSKLSHIFHTAAFTGGYAVGGKYVPNTLTKVIVTDADVIKDTAFADVYTLEEVSINADVTDMGASAFKGCNRLIKLSLPFVGKNTNPATPAAEKRFGHIFGTTSYDDSYLADLFYIPSSLIDVQILGISTIPESAFYKCSSLENIVFADQTITTIGNHAFRDCTSLIEFSIPQDVTTIGNSAFKGATQLAEIIIPFDMQNIQDNAFESCTGLVSVYFDQTSAILEIGNSAFKGCTNLEGVHDFPIAVKNIKASAFEGCAKMYKLKFPAGSQLTEIGASAFKGCVAYGETVLVLPKPLKTIGTSAFENCSKLEAVQFEEGGTLLTIGESAFRNCQLLTSVSIPSTVTTINASAFKDDVLLASISIPLSVTTIGASAFENCHAAQDIYIPNNASLITIGAAAFKGCSAVTSLILPVSLSEIGLGAFNGCTNLSYIYLPFVGKHRTGVGAEGRFGYIFGTNQYEGSYNADGYYLPLLLTKVVVPPRSSMKIAESAFKGCKEIKSISLISALQIYLDEIGEGAFEGCSGLEEIELPYTGKNKTAAGNDARFGHIFGKNPYDGSYSAGVYYIPQTLKYVRIYSGTTNIHIEPNAFLDCSYIEHLKLSHYMINYISGGALKGCSGLEILELAFVGRTRVNSLVVKENMFGYIFGEEVYSNSYQAGDFYIPTSLKYVDTGNGGVAYEIAEQAFNGCDSLTHVVIGQDVDYVGENIFNGCTQVSIFIHLDPPLDSGIWDANWNPAPRPFYYASQWGFGVDGYPHPLP